MSAYESTRTERAFSRRRCPHCNAGAFKRLPAAVGSSPNLRKCNACHRVFDLFKDTQKAEKPTAHTKSGVVPVPCREREWKPLVRNPFEHMRLAMVTR